MNKFVFATMVVFTMVFIVGCGHNVLSYSSGKYLNVGLDPNTQKTGIQYINGEFITVVDRENTKLEVQMKDSVGEDGKTTQSVHKIIYTIGNQVNGYTVDLKEVEKGK